MTDAFVQPISRAALMTMCVVGLAGADACSSAPATAEDLSSESPPGIEFRPGGCPGCQAEYAHSSHNWVGALAAILLSHGELSSFPWSTTNCAALDQDITTWNAAGKNAHVTNGGLLTVVVAGTHRGTLSTLSIAGNPGFASKLQGDIWACAIAEMGGTEVGQLGYVQSFMSLGSSTLGVDPDLAQLSGNLTAGANSSAAAVNEDGTPVTAYYVPSTGLVSTTIATAVRAAASASVPYAVPCAPVKVAAGQYVYGIVYVEGSTNAVYCECPSSGACYGS